MSAHLLGVVTPLHFARLDLLVPSNSLRRLQNLHQMLGVVQISCTSNPSNGAYSSGTLKHFFNLDLHNSSASSERFSNSHVLSVGQGVTFRRSQLTGAESSGLGPDHPTLCRDIFAKSFCECEGCLS